MKNILISLILLIGFSLNLLSQDFCMRLQTSFDPVYAPFYHGVASGDPLHDRVIIWTRVTPANHGVESIGVDWYVATDSLFANIVNSGNYETSPDIDYTVKIDVDGLEPYSYYYYYFHAEGRNSVIGRTKTIPVEDMEQLRFAAIHGTNYNHGYYNAYRALANRNDFEFVIHLGDYIYEYASHQYGNHQERWLMPEHELLTLDDYRTRYSHYRLDPDKRFIHQQYPWYLIWDDHEIADDTFIDGAVNHDPDTQGPFEDRKAAAIQAYFEWLPLRPVEDPDNPANLIRKKINWGNLAKLFLLDTRNEARMDARGLPNDSPDKVLLGEDQYNWLSEGLYNSYHNQNLPWRVIANQVMFVPLRLFGIPVNRDQWDGYEFERQRLLDFFSDNNIKNSVIISGDIHTAWANEIHNPSLGEYGEQGQSCIYAAEFICTSISSPSVNFGQGIGATTIKWQNPHVQYVELLHRGYSIFDITEARVQSDYYFVDNINSLDFYEFYGTSWFLNKNENFLRETNEPAPAYQVWEIPLVSDIPKLTVGIEESIVEHSEFVLLSGFPNPSSGYLFIQFHLNESKMLEFNVYDNNGKNVYNEKKSFVKCDIQYHSFDFTQLNSGQYILEISNSSGQRLSSKQFIILK